MVKPWSHTPVSLAFRISAYIEEEVQRRLQDLRCAVGNGTSTPAETAKVSHGAGDPLMRFQDDLSISNWGGFFFFFLSF